MWEILLIRLIEVESPYLKLWAKIALASLICFCQGILPHGDADPTTVHLPPIAGIAPQELMRVCRLWKIDWQLGKVFLEHRLGQSGQSMCSKSVEWNLKAETGGYSPEKNASLFNYSSVKISISMSQNAAQSSNSAQRWYCWQTFLTHQNFGWGSPVWGKTDPQSVRDVNVIFRFMVVDQEMLGESQFGHISIQRTHCHNLSELLSLEALLWSMETGVNNHLMKEKPYHPYEEELLTKCRVLSFHAPVNFYHLKK